MKRMWFVFISLFALTFILTACEIPRPGGILSPTATAPIAATPIAPEGESLLDDSSRVLVNKPTTAFVPGEVLVKFTPDSAQKLPTEKQEGVQALSVGAEGLDAIFAEVGITGLEPILSPVAQAGGQSIQSLAAQTGDAQQVFIASFDPQQDPNMVVDTLKQKTEVEYAEPNYVAFASAEPVTRPAAATPNDPFYPRQWNMQAIQMPQAWDISSGAGVVIAVLDTGVAYKTQNNFTQAPDLAGTTFVGGYDFVNKTNTPNDDNGHGTHVAGTIAQTTNNGVGVSGVAYGASIMPVKVLDSLGQGTYAGIIQGIDYAIANGAKIINMSLSGHSGSQALQDAVNRARSHGVLVVAAAGNNGGAVEYPAKYNSVIAVGAVRYDQTRPSYSNTGAEVDVVAPGGDNNIDQNGDGFGDGIVQQTFKTGETNTFRYLFMEGTSMATPHVSGILALLLSAQPGATADQLEGALKGSALDLGPAGVDQEYGAGLVQAASALAAIGAGPAQPTATPTSPIGPTATPTTPVGPTATPTTPAPTATVPVTPGPAGDLIINGNFEGNDGWEFRWTPRQGQYSTAVAHSGTRSAITGIADPNLDTFAYSSVAQKVTIPANAKKATLKAYVYPASTDMPSADSQYIMVLNSNFMVMTALYQNLSNEKAWQEKSYDLTPYAGQTIYVYFGAVNVRANGKVTALYVDDVSLVVQQ